MGHSAGRWAFQPRIVVKELRSFTEHILGKGSLINLSNLARLYGMPEQPLQRRLSMIGLTAVEARLLADAVDGAADLFRRMSGTLRARADDLEARYPEVQVGAPWLPVPRTKGTATPGPTGEALDDVTSPAAPDEEPADEADGAADGADLGVVDDVPDAREAAAA